MIGGKSTLLRQVCCCAILAQIGCMVPASSFRLTPIDRIFTRVGANDKIMHGKSTFLVELTETASILKNATMRSLVILDELGRGTSTWDGCAIARSVVKQLSAKVGCLALFATHYHVLQQVFADNPLVASYHMASSVTNEEVVYLYKFVRGASDKSFGAAVAKLAHLPPDIIKLASKMSKQMENALSESVYQSDELAAENIYNYMKEHSSDLKYIQAHPDLPDELVAFELRLQKS